MLQRRELPVGAVATAAYGPHNKRTWRRRPKDDSSKSRAILESTIAHADPDRKGEGDKPRAAIEHSGTNDL